MSDFVIENGVLVDYDGHFCGTMIPAEVTSIAEGAFEYCPFLEEIKVAEENEFYADDEGVLYDIDFTTLIRCPSNWEGDSYEVVEGVTTIKKSAFEGCENLKYISLPDSVMYIEDRAFAKCRNLRGVEFSGDLIEEGKDLFKGCIYINEH